MTLPSANACVMNEPPGPEPGFKWGVLLAIVLTLPIWMLVLWWVWG